MSEIKLVIGALTTLRPRMIEAFRRVESMLKAGLTVEIVVSERKSKRTGEQNRNGR